MSENLICAIDIGSFKIATVVGIISKEHDEVRVIGFDSVPSHGVKKGLIVDIDLVTHAVEQCVEKAERMAGQKINSAFVSIGGPHITSLNSHGVVAVANAQGEISQDDIDRVIEAARAISLSGTRHIIEVSPREYVVDGQPGIKNPIGMSGVRLEVDTHIITASQTNLKNIDRCLADLGIANDGFIFSGLASADSVVTDTERELGVVLVDIGGGKTDICLYSEGSLSYSSSIGIGARHITNDIAVGLRVSLDSAEKIKLYLSKHFARRDEKIKKEAQLNLNDLLLPENVSEVSFRTLMDGIIGPRLEEVFKLIFEEIEKSGYATQIPSGVVVTGGGALTVGLIDMGKKVIGLPMRLGRPTGVTGLIDELINPQYATTVGLILNGRSNIMRGERSGKDFNQLLKNFSIGQQVNKVKDLLKQFIP